MVPVGMPIIEYRCAPSAKVEATSDEQDALKGSWKKPSSEEAIFKACKERQHADEVERLRQEEVAKQAAQLRRREEAKAKLAKWPDTISQDSQPRQAAKQPKLTLGKEEQLFSCPFACCLTRL